METRDLQERVHSLAHYLNQGHDWKWRGERGAHNGKVVISVEVDAFTFWELHAQQQQHREELRKQRDEIRRASRERALGRRGLAPGARASNSNSRKASKSVNGGASRSTDRTVPRPDDWR